MVDVVGIEPPLAAGEESGMESRAGCYVQGTTTTPNYR